MAESAIEADVEKDHRRAATSELAAESQRT
jgi:hypothetical protein